MSRRLLRWSLFVVGIAALATLSVVIAARTRPPERSIESYCREIASAETLDESLASFDPDRLETDVTALRRAARVAPADIEHHVGTLLSLTTTLQETIEAARTDHAGAIETTLREEEPRAAEVTESGRVVEDYTRANCGIELNSTAVSPSGAR